jgi:hypothetical protein
MAAKGKRTVSRKALDKIAEHLAGLPEKKSLELSYREAIFEQSETLLAARNRGYSFEELAAVFSNGGIKISASTLKRYLREAGNSSNSQNETATKNRHQSKPVFTQPDKESTPQSEHTVRPSSLEKPRKFGQSRLQSDENSDRYPDGHGKPIEMKLDL